MMVLRVADVLGFGEGVGSRNWRRHLVCHIQVCFYTLLLSFLYWLLRGTIWFYELKAEVPLCFDPRQFSVWILLMYAVVVYYVTMMLKTVFALVQASQEEEMRLMLLSQYVDAVPPASLVSRNWEDQGLTPSELAHLPVRDLLDSESGIFTCSICLEELKPKDRIRSLLCGHHFHIGCIDEWLVRRSHCPNCNRSSHREIESF